MFYEGFMKKTSRGCILGLKESFFNEITWGISKIQMLVGVNQALAKI